MSKSFPGPSRVARPTSTAADPRRPSGTRRPRGGSSGRDRRTAPARRRPDAAAPTAFRHRHPVLTALLPVALVGVAIATMVTIKVASNSSQPSSAASPAVSGVADPGTSRLPASIAASVSSVSATTFDAVASSGSVLVPTRVDGNSAILRGADGKPEVVYIGAEYCPYCAAERWALAVALSRFGTFSNLSATHSSSSDVYPNTQTLSFYGSTYSSPYLDFSPVELQTNQLVNGSYPTLQTPTPAEQSLLATYDGAPYTSEPGSIPFIDIGDRYVISGASYSPQVLQGLSRAQIAAQLNDPSSPVAQAIDATANDITAAICSITGNQPSSVCDTPAIQAITKSLGA